MGKYKSLITNIAVFALGSFSSRLLVFVLMPLYTRVLSTADYGTVDIIINTCNLILPVMYLSISEAVIRFGLDKSHRKSDVFSVGLFTVLGGYLIFLCFFPLLGKIGLISDYIRLIYLYTLTSSLRTLITNFVRSNGFVRLFAIDGLFTTALTVGGNVLFLVKFQMGVTGYILSTVIADAVSSLCLFFMLRLYRFVHFRLRNPDTRRQMLRYALPMIPTAVFWWVTNLSDRYFITLMVDRGTNGLYSVAAKIPQAITIVSAIFIQAWQISAFTEYKSKEGERFYSNVFKSYYTFIFLAASGLILLAKPIIALMTSEAYYDAWQFVPFLVLAVSFSCLVTFLGTIYNAVKKNKMVTVTTFVGAVINFGLNWLLIPKYSAQGAAFATFISYLVVFLIRAIDTRRYIRIQMQPLRIGLSLALLLTQTWIALTVPKGWVAWEILMFILLLACNFNYLLYLARQLFSAARRRTA